MLFRSVTHQKHEWPDTSVFRMVSDWCNTQHCRIAGNCDKIRNEFTSRLCLNKISKEPNTVVQDLMYHFYESTYRGIVNTEKIQLKVQANAQSTVYRKSLEQFKASLLAENEAKTKIQEEFLTKDLNYWSGKIASLRKDKGSDSNQRLLGYISLGCYSLSRRSIDGGDQQQAQKFLEIYRLADPENSEWAFLWACLDEQKGNRNGTIAHLKIAHQLGLNDSQKVLKEKWLSRAVEDEQVRQLIASMH